MVRLKNRYLFIKIYTQDTIQNISNLLLNAIKQSISLNFGDYGSATSILSLKYINSQTQTAILRCNRELVKSVWASISMISEIDSKRCSLFVVHLSGTIKQCQVFAVSFNRQLIYDMIDKLGEKEVRRLINCTVRELEGLQQ